MSKEAWWPTDYSTEIYNHLRRKEKKRPVFHAQSPQLQYRRSVVEWILSVCETLELCTLVQHLAVYYLDFFMDNHKINEERLQLVALGCILVAAKVDEKDSLIPKTTDLNKIAGDCYELYEFIQMELAIMEFFNWKLLTPTTAHFLQYFSVSAVFPTDLHAGRPIVSMTQLCYSADQYISYFLDVSLLEVSFLSFRPSLIASSCIAAMRICLFLSPVWPTSLQSLTRYKSDDLTPCIEKLLRILEEEKKSFQEKKNRQSQPGSKRKACDDSPPSPISPCLV